MKKLLLILMLTVMAAPAFASDTLEKDPAVIFVSNLSNRFINEIFTGNASEQKKVETFKKEFLANSDIKFISRFVLGKAWKSADEAARNNFEKAFSDAVVLTWAGRFKEYNGQKIEEKAVRAAQSGQVYVDSVVISPDAKVKPISLIWRLKNSEDGYKIVDLIIEGVSMTMTYRNEYLAVLQAKNNDVNALSEALAKKNSQLEENLGVNI